MAGVPGTPGLPGEPGRDGFMGLKGEKVQIFHLLLLRLHLIRLTQAFYSSLFMYRVMPVLAVPL